MYLKNFLETQNLSGLAFAKKHNLSQSTISRAVNGKAVSASNAFKIEKATSGLVSLTELLCPQQKTAPGLD
jgi:DNA-binding transcriptional regulator YdaS (Cro superfamily)